MAGGEPGRGVEVVSGAAGDGVAAVELREPGGRPLSAEVDQEQAGLRAAARAGDLLQHGAPGPGDGGILVEAAAAAEADGDEPGGGVDMVDGQRRVVHGHVVRGSAGEVLGVQPGDVRVRRQGVPAEAVDGAEHGELLHPELPVVAGPAGRMGADGAEGGGEEQSR